MENGTGEQIDGDRIISELLSDLELAYGAASDASRRFMVAMQSGDTSAAGLMIPEIRTAHADVLRCLTECRDVLRVQISENHRRLQESAVVAGAVAVDGSPSFVGQAAAVFVMIFGIAAAAALLVRGFLKG